MPKKVLNHVQVSYFAAVAVEKQFSTALKETAENISVNGKPDSSIGRTKPTKQSV